MYRIAICGHLAEGKNFTDGQTIKTKSLKDELSKKFSDKQIDLVDTHNWSKNPIKLLYKILKSIKRCNLIIILPAHNGLKVILPLFVILNKFFNKKLYYIVIGGWLSQYLKLNPKLLNYCLGLDGIFVESQKMKRELLNLQLKKIYYMPNFKNLIPVSSDFIEKKYYSIPLKAVMLSRVIKDKGINIAIDAVRKINKLNKNNIILDIYGPISDDYEIEFQHLLKENTGIVFYKGIVEYNNTSEVLKNYSVLLFPTFYEGEGFPGTVIDAFSAGLPVIASDWRYNTEIIEDGVTGLICKTHNTQSLINCLNKVIDNPEVLREMGKNCLEDVKKYCSDKVVSDFLEIVQT